MGKLGKQSIIDLDQLPANMEMDRMDSFAMMHWSTINDHWADENWQCPYTLTRSGMTAHQKR